jgi:hypothetical protein
MNFISPISTKEPRIQNITDKLDYPVFSGASLNSYYQYASISANNNQIIFNCAIPSENTLIDRNVLINATYKINLIITNITAGATAFNYGLGECFQAFPIHSSIKNMTCSINNTSFSINTQDVIQPLLKLIEPREFQRFNGMTPTMPDLYFNNYTDAIGSKADITGDYKESSFDNKLIPRGAHPLKSITVVHTKAAGGTDSSLVSTNAADSWIITLESEFTEPLLLSPFLFHSKHNYNNQAMYGISSINLNINLDTSLKRFFTTNNNNIQIKFDDTNPITDAKLLFNFLNIQDIDKIPSRNLIPYMDYPVYISADSDNITPGQNKILFSQNFQLNQVPDLLILCVRRPMATNTIRNTNSFLPIRNISINFNNNSGLLSSATPQDLYRLSKVNGSIQSWYEFWGYANKNNNNPAITTLSQYLYTTSGSLIVINPVKDLGLPYWLSNGSIGNFNIQFKINVINNTTDNFIPEIVIITPNSGFIINENGNTEIYTGILSKEIVVETLLKKNNIPSIENPLIGSGLDKDTKKKSSILDDLLN